MGGNSQFRLQALVYDILPLATAKPGYTTGLRKLFGVWRKVLESDARSVLSVQTQPPRSRSRHN